eukprot:329848-Rhodomonas_salina.6
MGLERWRALSSLREKIQKNILLLSNANPFPGVGPAPSPAVLFRGRLDAEVEPHPLGAHPLRLRVAAKTRRSGRDRQSALSSTGMLWRSTRCRFMSHCQCWLARDEGVPWHTKHNQKIKTSDKGQGPSYLWPEATIFWNKLPGSPGQGVRLMAGGMGLTGGCAVQGTTVKSVGDI